MKALLAAVATGVTIALAFPSTGWFPLALVAWAPILVLARSWGTKRRFWMGWIVGFTTNVICFRWIDFTLDVMTNLPDWSHPVGLILFAAWHGLLAAIFLALAEPIRLAAERARAGSGAMMVAASFAALEWAFPFLFPWGYGQALWKVSAFTSVMALTGVAGLTFVAMAFNTLIADLWISRRRQALLWAAAILVPLLLFGGIWSLAINATGDGRTLRVAILQPNHTLEDKQIIASGSAKARGVRRRLLSSFLAQVEELESGEHDLVVAPEGAYPFLWILDPNKNDPYQRANTWATRRVVMAVAKGPAADTIIGGLRLPGGDQRLRNSAVHFGPGGEILGLYDKQVLVPFGEYMPGRDMFPSLAESVRGISNFGSGDTPCRFEVAGEVASCGICYETLFEDATRQDLGDASLLLNLSIDTWFGEGVAAEFHLMSQAGRAAELGVPLLRAALTGISGVVGPDGVLGERLDVGVRGILKTEVTIPTIQTPYRMMGPLFRWIFVGLTLWALVDIWRARRRRKREEQKVAAEAAEPALEATEAEPDTPAEHL